MLFINIALFALYCAYLLNLKFFYLSIVKTRIASTVCNNSKNANEMSASLTFNKHSFFEHPSIALHPATVTMGVEVEDEEKFREIGVLTPRSLTDSDLEPRQGVSVDATQKEVSEIEFLLMVSVVEGDKHEEMLDDLSDLWESDLDATVFDMSFPHCHKACHKEVLPLNTTEMVRLVVDYGTYFIGSIAGQPCNVYIPAPPVGQGFLPKIHSYYLMDLKFVGGPLIWEATQVYTKLPTQGMHVSSMAVIQPPDPNWYIEETTHLRTEHVYEVPTPSSYLGAIIGSGGKNINALMKKITESQDSYRSHHTNPEVTLTPLGTDSFRVHISINYYCKWTTVEVHEFISHMHC